MTLTASFIQKAVTATTHSQLAVKKQSQLVNKAQRPFTAPAAPGARQLPSPRARLMATHMSFRQRQQYYYAGLAKQCTRQNLLTTPSLIIL